MFTLAKLENTVLSAQTLIRDNCGGNNERELALNVRLTHMVELYHPVGENFEDSQLYDTTSQNKQAFAAFIYELVQESRRRSGRRAVADS